MLCRAALEAVRRWGVRWGRVTAAAAGSSTTASWRRSSYMAAVGCLGVDVLVRLFIPDADRTPVPHVDAGDARTGTAAGVVSYRCRCSCRLGRRYEDDVMKLSSSSGGGSWLDLYHGDILDGVREWGVENLWP